jgi:DDE family transposase
MTDSASKSSQTCLSATIANINHLFNYSEEILHEHHLSDPDFYRIVEEQKKIAAAIAAADTKEDHQPVKSPVQDTCVQPELIQSILFKRFSQAELKEKIAKNQEIIHEALVETQSLIAPRTEAHNRKQPYSSTEEETSDRSEKLSVQIQAWRSLLPVLIRRFASIPDPRRTKSIKHKMAVVMLYGLFAFIFQLQSRRAINRELSGPMLFEHLKRIFPELESIPHADTVARLLSRINPDEIEKTHLALINQLIRNKKFRKLLIAGCLPVAIDGTQKLYRDGEFQDLRWLNRKVGRIGDQSTQQYVYVLEANIVFRNGLTISLLSEYLKTDCDVLTNPEGKQECELVAFERLSAKLKKYFPRLKIIMFADALFATQPVLEILEGYQWEYMIYFSRNKLTDFARILNTARGTQQSLSDNPYYRGREQTFHWYNDVSWGYNWQLNIHLVCCQENWQEVDRKTGEIITKYSQKQWISSIKINVDNIHELCNLGARKIWLMEDSINTEKHRGYHYEHAFSYDWQAMQGFHLLMRLAHAVNAISEFTKKLKKWIKEQGCGAILKLIRGAPRGAHWVVAERAIMEAVPAASCTEPWAGASNDTGQA